MPSSDQTATSTSSRMVPRNLRVRIVMAEMCGFRVSLRCGRRRTIRGTQSVQALGLSAPEMTTISAPTRPASRRALVADFRGRPDRADGAGRRRDAADGVRPVDRRVEAGHRQRCRRCREAQWQSAFEAYKTIPQYRELNAGMTPVRVQDDLLVGMEPPAARPRDRRGLSAAVPVLPVARRSVPAS